MIENFLLNVVSILGRATFAVLAFVVFCAALCLMMVAIRVVILLATKLTSKE